MNNFPFINLTRGIFKYTFNSDKMFYLYTIVSFNNKIII